MQRKHMPLDFHKANICIAQTDKNRDSFCINQTCDAPYFILRSKDQEFSS